MRKDCQEESTMKKMTEDERFMKEAVRQAKKAAALGDVPIGCVIEPEGTTAGWRIKTPSPTQKYLP